jgi:3-hydroxybutyrate dehydrogenase
MLMQDKVAIVTGAASGIGRGIALAFAREGAKVAIADMNLEGAEAVAKSIRDDGGQAIGVAMNVTSEEEVNSGVEKTVNEFGRVDVLVSNAGVQIVHPVHEFPFDQWKTMLAIHLDGAFLTTKACLKHMYGQG